MVCANKIWKALKDLFANRFSLLPCELKDIKFYVLMWTLVLLHQIMGHHNVTLYCCFYLEEMKFYFYH